MIISQEPADSGEYAVLNSSNNTNSESSTSQTTTTTTKLDDANLINDKDKTDSFWKVPVFLLCLVCFIENFLITGSASVVLSTLEKEFYLTSAQSGFFLGIYELAGFFSAPIFGFFASSNRVQKLHLICISLSLLTLGSYLIGFLVFLKKPDLDFILSNPNAVNETNSNLCTRWNETNASFCDDIIKLDSKSSSLYLLIYLGHLLIGFGGVAIYSVGVPYIELITTAEQSPFCQAIFFGAGAIGGGVGIVLTGQFLNINSRFYMRSLILPDWLNQTSPYWIGAWWLPYLIYGSVCLLLCTLIFSFTLIFEQRLNELQQKARHNDNRRLEPKANLLDSIKNFTAKTKTFFSNVELLLLAMAAVSEGIILKGFLGFMPKYIEYQFEIPASTATMLTGLIALVSVIGGTLFSAFLIKKFAWTVKHCSAFCFFIFFFTSFLFLISLNFCPEEKFINNHVNFTCAQCQCANTFNPVCFKSGELNAFQSPCFAGCTLSLGNNQFTNCSCLTEASVVLASENCVNGIKCREKMWVNGVAAFFIVFFTAVSVIPLIKATLGCVDSSFQSFSMGLKASMVAVLGNLAGTVLVGIAIDNTCTNWLSNCYQQKVCKLYNNEHMSVAFGSIGFTCRFLSAVFMFFVCLPYFLKWK